MNTRRDKFYDRIAEGLSGMGLRTLPTRSEWEDALDRQKAYTLDALKARQCAMTFEGAVWVVVQFRRGLSLLERGNLPLDDERKTSYRGCDQHGNDQRPYNWTPFGPGSYFGQEVDCWKELPE